MSSLFNGIKSNDLTFIKSLKVENGNLEIKFIGQKREINGKGWPDLDGDFFELSISFEDISNLRLIFDGQKYQQISGFEIIDISNDGLEKVNYHIIDYENGVLNFYCSGFSLGVETNFQPGIEIGFRNPH